MRQVLYTLFICLLISVIFIPVTNATLIDNGDGTITDTLTNLMWLQDGNFVATQEDSTKMMGNTSYPASAWSWNYGIMESWDLAVNWAASLTTAGFTDWRLTSKTNNELTTLVNNILSEYTDVYSSLFFMTPTSDGNPPWGSWFWTGEEIDSNYAWYAMNLNTPSPSYGTGWKNSGFRAWAVRNNIAVVTEKGSLLIFLLAMTGICIFGRFAIYNKH